jgi:hypothetical protein
MSKRRRIDNPDIIPLALHELGGVGEFIDVEDIFLRCFEIAPERFRWRKHNLPNYKTLSKALRDFEGDHPGLLLKTEDGLSRQLSGDGVEWVRSRTTDYAQLRSQPGSNPPTRRREYKILNEFAEHKAMKLFMEGKKPSLVKYEVADMLLCSPDSPSAVWMERYETYRSAAQDAGRPDIVGFLEFLKSSRPQWFGGKASE